jgi:hypothetical protein
MRTSLLRGGLTGVHLIGVYLVSVHLAGVYLMGVYFMGVHLMSVSHRRDPAGMQLVDGWVL